MSDRNPESRRVRTRRLGAAGLAAAVVAGLALPGNRLGAGVVVAAVCVALAVIVGSERRPSRFALACGGLGLALATMAVVRDWSTLVVVDLAAGTVLASIGLTEARSGRAVGRAVIGSIGLLPRGAATVVEGLRPPARVPPRRPLRPVARGLAIGAGLLLPFGALFASADRAFAQLAGDALSPDVELGLLPLRVAVAIGAAALVGSLALARGAVEEPAGAPGWRLQPAEWGIALVALVAFFGAFVTLQVAVLLGGHDHVLETAGLTYAEYAREGFVELVAVAALTLTVIGVALRHASATTARQRRVRDVLLGGLCLLTLVVLASALRRLGLYEDAFGFTRARVSGEAFALWLGGVLMLVLAAGAAGRREWVSRGVVLMSGLALLAFTLSNPDSRVAEGNTERFARTGKVDVDYLRGLSADAVPALAKLPPEVAACALEPAARRLSEPDGWAEANLSRARARRALEGGRAC